MTVPDGVAIAPTVHALAIQRDEPGLAHLLIAGFLERFILGNNHGFEPHRPQRSQASYIHRRAVLL
jgi:hypothetical protein